MADNSTVHPNPTAEVENKTPVVTVVIPVFNSETTLNAAIASVVGQTLHDLELLIVNDGSTDTSLQIAENAAASDMRVRVISMEKNGGKPRALNRCIDLVRGRWIALLDADDTYQPDRLETLIAMGERHGADMVADDQNHIDSVTGKHVTSAFLGYRFANPVDRAAFLRLASYPHKEFDGGILKTITRVDFIRQHGLRYNEQAGLGEDFYYLMEFFMRGGKLWVSDQPLYNWTMPFSTSTRRWTTTAQGAWRYDYRRTFPTHNHYVSSLDKASDSDVLAMLARRGRRMHQMMHYTDAQRAAAEGRKAVALGILARHPSTLPVLMRRIVRRYRRALTS
jgi:succinoglycan biosynthesis protein ExoO